MRKKTQKYFNIYGITLLLSSMVLTPLASLSVWADTMDSGEESIVSFSETEQSSFSENNEFVTEETSESDTNEVSLEEEVLVETSELEVEETTVATTETTNETTEELQVQEFGQGKSNSREVDNWEDFKKNFEDPSVSRIVLTNDVIGDDQSEPLAPLTRSLVIEGRGARLVLPGGTTNPIVLGKTQKNAELTLVNLIMGINETEEVTNEGRMRIISSPKEANDGEKWTVNLNGVREVLFSENLAGQQQFVYIQNGTVKFNGGTNQLKMVSVNTTLIEAKHVEITGKDTIVNINVDKGNIVDEGSDKTTIFSGSEVDNSTFTMSDGAKLEMTSPRRVRGVHLEGQNSELTISGGAKFNIKGEASSVGAQIIGEKSKFNLSQSATFEVTGKEDVLGVEMRGKDIRSSLSEGSTFDIKGMDTTRGISLKSNHPKLSIADATFKVTGNKFLSGVNFTPYMGSGSEAQFNLSKGNFEVVGGEESRGIESTLPNTTVTIDGSEFKAQLSNGSNGIFMNRGNPILEIKNKSNVQMIKNWHQIPSSVSQNPDLIFLSGDNPSLSIVGSEVSLEDTNESTIQVPTPLRQGGIRLQGTKTAKMDVLESQVNVNITQGMGVSVNGTGSTEFTVGKKANFKIGKDEQKSWLPSLEVLGKKGEMKVSDGAELTAANLVFSVPKFEVTGAKASFVGGREGKTTVHSQSQVEKAGIYVNEKGQLNVENPFGEQAVVFSGENALFIISGSGARSEIKTSTRLKPDGNYGFIEVTPPSPPSQPAVTFQKDRGMMLTDTGGESSVEGKVLFLEITSSFVVAGPTSKSTLEVMTGPVLEFKKGFSQLTVNDLGSLKILGEDPDGIIYGDELKVFLSKPYHIDFANRVDDVAYSAGKRIFKTANSKSSFYAVDSPIELWKNNQSHSLDATHQILRNETYEFKGVDLKTPTQSDLIKPNPGQNQGLDQYTRMVAQRKDRGIFDELYVPTNADKKIYGHFKVFSAETDKYRDAAPNEVSADVIITRQDGTEITYPNVKSTNEVKAYDQDTRNGMFELKLPDMLEAGDKVSVTNVKINDRAGENKTEEVTVFAIQPPQPAAFTTLNLLNTTKVINGEGAPGSVVTAELNGQPMSLKNDVLIGLDGTFQLELADTVTLNVDDKIQVFLRDKNGSATSAKVKDVPVTNNDSGNINPSSELAYHDTTFAPATILTVVSGPQGALELIEVKAWTFGTHQISTNDETYSTEEVNDLTFKDLRPLGQTANWKLHVKQESQFKNENGDELVGASLSYKGAKLTGTHWNNETLQPLGSIADQTLNIGSKILVTDNAATKNQRGTFVIDFNTVELMVPGSTIPEIEEYTTSLNWSFEDTPANISE